MLRCCNRLLCRLFLLLATLGLGWVPAAHAGHVTIDCNDPSLADLAAAVQSNLGSSGGGFDQDSTADFGMHAGNVYTQSCKYINGFDMVHAYMFVDFKEPDGSRSPTTAVYAGWQVTGVIGDVDGDGNPDLRTSNNPLCASQILQDLQGIGRDEYYTFRMVFCSGTIVQVTLTNGSMTVTKNGLQIPTPATVTRVFSGSTLKVCITDLEAIIGNEDINGMQLAMGAIALYDYMGGDGTNLVQLNLPNTIDVSMMPTGPIACLGGPIEYTITIRNPGITTLDTITMTDVLQNGQTYVLDDGGSTGDATTRNWSFPSANLAPGGTMVVHLTALAPLFCSGALASTVQVAGNNTCGTAGEASADTTATVQCGQLGVAVRDTSTCVGTAVTLCAILTAGNAGIAHYLWSGPGGPFADAACIVIPDSDVNVTGPLAYHVTVIDANGCSGSDDGTVTVTAWPSCAISPADTTIESGGSVTLCGPDDAAFTYLWSTGATTRCITVSDAGNYVLTVASAAACTTSCTATVRLANGGTLDVMSLPTELSFGTAQPNPTGTPMSIRYGLPSESRVSAQVYDVAGRMVRDLREHLIGAGWHTLSWDLRSDAGQKVIPGLYFLRVAVNGRMQVRPVTVLQ